MLPKSQHKESHRPLLLERSYEIGEMTTENPKAIDLLPKGLRDSYQALMDFTEKYAPKFVEQERPF